jgi:dTDP-4-amino-4,6-dideoxygalactose transaminase
MASGACLQVPDIPLFKVFMAESAASAVTRVLYSGYIGEGEEVAIFERELAARLGTPAVMTVNSGTSALHLACHMCVDGDADAQIISTPMTCMATNTPIVQNGARIVWADVDPLTGNIDPDEIEPLITDKTKGVMAVHWGGNPCDMDRIREIGRARGIRVIEDAAHALGSTYRGEPTGRHSDFVAFSFQAIKQVTSIDGGCLVCKDAADDARGRLLRWYGIDRAVVEPTDLRCETDVVEPGYKFHMNNVAAAIGRENLKHLDWILTRHRENARFYDAAFRGANSITAAPENRDGTSSCWLYTIHVANRDEVMQGLREQGIGASKVHARNDTHSAFAGFRRPLPNCEQFNRTHLCIPVGWWVSDSDRERVAEVTIKLAR